MDKQSYNFYANDKLGFFTDHVLIPNNKSGKMTKMELFGWKQQILHTDYILIRKARCQGISELIAAEIAYNLNFKNDYDMICMTGTQPMAMEMKHKVERHFCNIPDNIRIGLSASHNKNSYCTTNDNRIIFSAEDVHAGHSRSFNAMYFEEVDMMRDFENIFASMTPCFRGIGNPDEKLLISASPLSTNSFFHKLWNNQNNKFDKMEITYLSQMYNTTRRKTLNDITKTAYSKIIRECAIS